MALIKPTTLVSLSAKISLLSAFSVPERAPGRAATCRVEYVLSIGLLPGL
jgi:hypothetical protein